MTLYIRKYFASFAITLLSVALMLALSCPLNAQNAFGSIVGTVTDSSGAIVPGANITLTDIGTNERKVVQTDAAGNYRFVNLLPAQYKVEFEKASYKHLVQSPVSVLVDSTSRLDVTLQVGAVSETVEVTTQAPLLQTESGTLGSQVEGKTVQQMPLNGRNVMNLVALAPGVVPQGASMGNATLNQGGGHTNNSGWGNYQLGGAIGGQGSMYIDGAPLNVLYAHAVAFIPTQDAIQEFKVSTNAVSPEFGRFAGGVVEMTTKSGSNSFHGSAYEYLRNTVLNANLWNSPSKAKWIQNQLGVAAGGPVLKNKAFFFFSWERFSSRTSSPNDTNVPDTGMMADTNPSVPGNITSGIVLPASQAACLSYSAVTNRTTIATSCVDATSKVIKNYFQSSPSVPSASGNYNALVPGGSTNRQYNVRGDINLTPNQRLFLRYSDINTSDMPYDGMASHSGFKTGGSFSNYPTKQAIVGDTITINQKTIADVRLSFLRSYFGDIPPDSGANLSALGLGSNWAAINSQQAVKELPPLYLNGGYNFYPYHGFGITSLRYVNNYALSASIIRLQGAHTLKFGGQVFLFDNNALPYFQPGVLSVDNTNYTHDEWANFLLGDINNFSFQIPIRTGAYNWYQGYFVNDTWSATRKLTVTAGLRWELPGALAERKDRTTVLLPNADAVINGSTAHGLLGLVNSSLWSARTTEPVKHNLFSPRIGVAYRLNEKTVVRAGFALAYLPPNIANGAEPSQSPISEATTQTFNTSDSVVKYTVNNPLGVGTANAVTVNQPAGRNNPNFMNQYANVSPQLQSISGPVPTSKFPYMQQWNLTVGRQFKGEQSLEVSYAGAIGTHLPAPGESGWGLNQLDDANVAKLAVGTITATQAQAARPHPSYQNVVDTNPLNGTMTYNALQATYQKHIGSGMLNSGYTYAKSIGDTDGVKGWLDNGAIGVIQNYNNIHQERSVLSWNITQRWVTSYILDLPFGKGQMWANNLNPVIDRIIGGWAVNGITTLQTGQPIMITQANNAFANNYGAGQIRPNAKAGCSKLTSGSAQSRLGKWFDPTCYSQVGNYAMGNEPRVDPKLHSAGIANWDFTMQKGTRITESTNLLFRMEFFNMFNRRQFGPPDMNISHGTSFGGSINGQQNNPRQIQASLRFSF